MKNNKIRKSATVLCCLDIFSLSACSLEGRWKKRSTFRSPDGLLGTVCVQDIAKFKQNFFEGPKEQLVTTKILPVCLVSTLRVFWILMTYEGWLEGDCYKLFPERFHHDSQDRIYNAIKLTCYQVAHADPLPASLAILLHSPSAINRRSCSGVQLESRVYFCKP